MYKRLVVGKHSLNRIHCHILRVKALYLKRWKENSWDKDETRDSQEFLQVEKEIYKQSMPQNAELFEGEEDEEDESGGGEQPAADKDKVEVIGESGLEGGSS